MKRLFAALMTAIVMALMTWIALSQPGSSRNAAQVPGDASGLADSRLQNHAMFADATARIESLLSSAAAGDVASYLAAFGGPLRDRLAREVDEIGRDNFARRLRKASQARKSHAVFAPERQGEGLEDVWITAESAFADRIERQRFRLERFPNGWLVAETATAREHVPKEPLGSQATFQEPEGPPVPGVADQPGSSQTE